MANVGSTPRKCFCGRAQPNFAHRGQQKPTHCAKCKEPGMINIRASTCACGKAVPSFGVQGAPVTALKGTLYALLVFVPPPSLKGSFHATVYSTDVIFVAFSGLRSMRSLPFMQYVWAICTIASPSLQGKSQSSNTCGCTRSTSGLGLFRMLADETPQSQQ